MSEVLKENKVFFLRKAKSRCFGLCLRFQKYNFSFLKRCSEAWEQYFWDFWFAPKKISQWKNLSVFQQLMFLYQLVNLVLETCFIFSKILNLNKTFCLKFLVLFWSFDQRALWFPYSGLFWEQNVQENVNSWVFGVFYKVNCGVDIGFWHISFRKMF